MNQKLLFSLPPVPSGPSGTGIVYLGWVPAASWFYVGKTENLAIRDRQHREEYEGWKSAVIMENCDSIALENRLHELFEAFRLKIGGFSRFDLLSFFDNCEWNVMRCKNPPLPGMHLLAAHSCGILVAAISRRSDELSFLKSLTHRLPEPRVDKNPAPSSGKETVFEGARRIVNAVRFFEDHTARQTFREWLESQADPLLKTGCPALYRDSPLTILK